MLNSEEITQWLGRFEIIRLCDSSSIYNNSRQQAPVRVQVVPLPGQTLSESECASLGIVFEKPDGSYQPLGEDDPSAEWFLTSVRDDRFDPYLTVAYPELPECQIPPPPSDIETLRKPPPSVPDPSTRMTDRYVHCQADGGASIRLRGVITKDSGETFYTDSTVFDHSVTLYAQSPHSLLFPGDYHCAISQPSLSKREGDIEEFVVSPQRTAFSFITLESQTPARVSGGTPPNELIERNQHTPLATAYAGDAALISHDVAASRPATGRQLSARIAAECPGDVLVSMKVTDARQAVGLPGDRHSQLVAYDRQGNQHRISFSDEDAPQQASSTSLPFSVTSDACIENAEVSNIDFFQVKGLGSSTHAAPCPVYDNLYQTTYVNVVIRALDSNLVPVELTTAQLNSIVLVNYDSGEALRDTEWYIAEEPRYPDDLFDLFPTTNDSLPSVSAQGDQVITIWLKTSSKANMEVAARLVLDGTTYHTYQKDVETGGKTVSGKSNSSAAIITHEKGYQLLPEDFRYTGKFLSFGELNGFERWKLSIKGNKYRICYSLYDDTDHYQGSDILIGWGIQVSFRAGRPRVANVSVGNSNFQIDINDEDSGYAAVAFALGSRGEDKNIAGLEVYLDQYGNSHSIWIRAHPGGYGRLLQWVGAEYYE